MKSLVREIKNRINLIELFRSGCGKVDGQDRALCPIHDDRNPSLQFYEDGHAYCFGCGWRIDVFLLYQHIHRCDFRTALLSLASQAGLDSSSSRGICNPGWASCKGRILAASQIRAYIIADNQLALDAAWDEELLGLELSDLKLDGYDLSLTGFDDLDIDRLLAGLDGGKEGLTDEDQVKHGPFRVPSSFFNSSDI